MYTEYMSRLYGIGALDSLGTQQLTAPPTVDCHERANVVSDWDWKPSDGAPRIAPGILALARDTTHLTGLIRGRALVESVSHKRSSD